MPIVKPKRNEMEHVHGHLTLQIFCFDCQYDSKFLIL